MRIRMALSTRLAVLLRCAVATGYILVKYDDVLLTKR